MDYFVHVVSGKKTWRTTEGSGRWKRVRRCFSKKASPSSIRTFKEDFCFLVFFVSDKFIRDVVREIAGQLNGQHDGEPLQKGAIIVNNDITLAAYFQSMLAYFIGTAKPADTLLTLKLKELIVSILLAAAIVSSRAIFNPCSKATHRRYRKLWRQIFVTTSAWKISQN
jgi:hypothetical protein